MFFLLYSNRHKPSGHHRLSSLGDRSRSVGDGLDGKSIDLDQRVLLFTSIGIGQNTVIRRPTLLYIHIKVHR